MSRHNLYSSVVPLIVCWRSIMDIYQRVNRGWRRGRLNPERVAHLRINPAVPLCVCVLITRTHARFAPVTLFT